MNPTVAALVAQAEQLSADDRDPLLVRLQQALAPAVEPEIEAAWMAEVERRVDALDRAEMRSVPWGRGQDAPGPLMRLEIADPALDDAEAARDHCVNIRTSLGTNFSNQFLRSVELIVAHPAAWAKAGNGARKRHMDQLSCSLIYRDDDELIRIVAVTHQRQRPRYWRSR